MGGVFVCVCVCVFTGVGEYVLCRLKSPSAAEISMEDQVRYFVLREAICCYECTYQQSLSRTADKLMPLRSLWRLEWSPDYEVRQCNSVRAVLLTSF